MGHVSTCHLARGFIVVAGSPLAAYFGPIAIRPVDSCPRAFGHSPGLALPTSISWWCGDWFAQQAQTWSLARDPAPLARAVSSNGVPPEAADPAVTVRDWASLAFTLWLELH